MEHTDKLTARWKFMVEGSHNPEGLAACLQTQFDYNKKHEMAPAFARLSVPLVVRIFGEGKAAKRNVFTNYFEDVVWPHLLTFRTKFEPPQPSAGNYDVLQAEANYCAILAKKLAVEVDEAFKDKRDMEVIFRGLGMLDDATIVMYYS